MPHTKELHYTDAKGIPTIARIEHKNRYGFSEVVIYQDGLPVHRQMGGVELFDQIKSDPRIKTTNK